MKLGWMIGCAGVTLAACGGKGEGSKTASGEPAPAPEVKLAAIDLGACGEAYQGLVVQAPAGAKAADDYGSCTVKAGAAFQLELGSAAADSLGKTKAEIGKNDVNKFERWLVEEADLLVYESKTMNSEFHVAAVVKVGDTYFRCEDAKGPTYAEADARLMGKACKTLAKK